MRLSKAQVSWFWREWSKACSIQGWMGEEKESRRRELIREIGFGSLTQVDRSAGFDRLKARVMALQYRIEGPLNELYPDLGDMRRHLHLIRSHYLPQLARLGVDPAAYVGEICRDKFGHTAPWESLADHPVHGPDLVRQLLYTLAARVSALSRRDLPASPSKSDISMITPPSGGPIGHHPPPAGPAPSH